jgi:hypothetical protein
MVLVARLGELNRGFNLYSNYQPLTNVTLPLGELVGMSFFGNCLKPILVLWQLHLLQNG